MLREHVHGVPSSLNVIAELVGEGRRVLDVGCASGYLAAAMRDRGCRVVGLDVNREAAEKARDVCHDVIVADLETEPLTQVAHEHGPFDAIVFGDVLEHLRNPFLVLDAARALLADGGFIVASIPNVAHGSIRLAMLEGRFDYQEFGLLDETHIRFFTRKSVEELLLTSGYRIERLERTTLALFEESDLVPQLRREAYAPNLISGVTSDPEHETLQFIIRAFPLSDEARIRALGKRVRAADAQDEQAKLTIAALEREAETLRKERKSLAEQAAELEKERNLHLAARDRADEVIAASAQRIRAMQRQLEALMVDVREAEDRLAEHAEAYDAIQHERADLHRVKIDLGERLEVLQTQLRDAHAQLHEQARENEAARRSNEDLAGRLQTAAQRTAILERDHAELYRSKREAAERLEALRREHDGLRAEHAAIVERFTAFADAVAERTHAQFVALACEIERIQSGTAWRFKQALAKRFRRR